MTPLRAWTLWLAEDAGVPACAIDFIPAAELAVFEDQAREVLEKIYG